MLIVHSKDGKHRIIAHLGEDVINVLRAMQARFDGELAIWDTRRKEWVPISELLLDTAKPWSGDSLPGVEREAG